VTPGAHDLTWVAAAPLWKGLLKDRERMRRPALLRFASDAFMEQLFALLESKPEELASVVAAREAGADALKLYQPVHGHFHLVTASLVCQRPGLPDHPVDAAREEKASFVLRRLAGDTELAWIPAADPGQSGAWAPVVPPEKILPGEELLPLFPARFVEEGRPRRLLAGLVPTSSRETFHAAEVTDPAEVTDDGEVVLKSSDPPSSEALVPKLGSRAGALYQIRCIYRKPRCKPPEPPVISDPTERFAIASYFDPDAPARAIRIAMPIDVSENGLKKLKKSVGFVLSNQLRKKLSRIKDGKKALDGEADPEDSDDKGEIWIFAIPIVTMVAMITLMAVVSLLDIIFSWASFVRVLVPIKLKAKG
jgi:hypothetical protein